MMPGRCLPSNLLAALVTLLWLLCQSSIVLATEVCTLQLGVDKMYLYVRCKDYCCKYNNGTQYCCSDCNLSINSDSCTPEQLWRYILYAGLGIAGAVVLCYLIVYLVKNCREPIKRACCKLRTARVQSPRISMTNASACFESSSEAPAHSLTIRGGPIAEHDDEVSRRLAPRNSALAARSSLYPQPPPAYSAAMAAAATASSTAAVAAMVEECDDSGGGVSDPPRRDGSATPPPMYSEAAHAAATAAASESTSAAIASDEPPPAYSESGWRATVAIDETAE